MLIKNVYKINAYDGGRVAERTQMLAPLKILNSSLYAYIYYIMGTRRKVLKTCEILLMVV